METTKETQKIPRVRAVRTFERPDRKRKPYYIDFRDDEGRHYEAFGSELARNQRAATLRRLMVGEEPDLPSRAEIQEWRLFKEATNGVPWERVVAGFRMHEATTKVEVPTVGQAAKTYLDAMQRLVDLNQMAKATFSHKNQKIGLFVDSFGHLPITSLQGKQIEEWIDDLGYEAHATFNSYRKIVRTFLSFFPKVLPHNPIDDFPKRDESVEHVEIITPQQTAKLFAFTLAKYPEALGRLAFEAFAGLRFSSAFRLEKADINFEDRGVTLPKHKIKTRRRHYIDGLPENLWLWLSKTNDGCWAMENSEWMHLKSRLFREAKVPHPRNCLRHSFCTYHVAAYKNPGLTATILCHKNQQKLWEYYYGNATQSSGMLYFSITPANAGVLASDATDDTPGIGSSEGTEVYSAAAASPA